MLFLFIHLPKTGNTKSSNCQMYPKTSLMKTIYYSSKICQPDTHCKGMQGFNYAIILCHLTPAYFSIYQQQHQSRHIFLCLAYTRYKNKNIPQFHVPVGYRCAVMLFGKLVWHPHCIHHLTVTITITFFYLCVHCL